MNKAIADITVPIKVYQKVVLFRNNQNIAPKPAPKSVGFRNGRLILNGKLIMADCIIYLPEKKKIAENKIPKNNELRTPK